MAIRYLWISIRAIQYTDRAFKAVNENVYALMNAEQKLKRTGEVLKLSAGMMWVALGAMALGGMMNMMKATSQGRRVMRDFEKSISSLTKAFGDAFVKILGPIVRILTVFLNVIASLPQPVLMVLSGVALFAVTAIIAKGATMALTSAMSLLGISMKTATFGTYQLINGEWVAITSTNGLTASLKGLKMSLSSCVTIFSTFVMIGMMFGKTGGIIIATIASIVAALAVYKMHLLGLSIAQAVASPWMIPAMIAGGLAMGGAIAAMGNFQVGTRKAQVTGPAIVHAGERVGKESQLKREFGGANATAKTSTNVTIHMSGNIQTKADKEELRPLILKTMKDALDNKA